jgi:cytosine/adenosine deaminase-related metal-dependent hydrolase
VHCPLVSARGGSILKSFSGLKARGINIAMGTDTTPPDMLMNLLVGLITCRVADAVMSRVRSADLFDAATLGGAKAPVEMISEASRRVRGRTSQFSAWTT